MQIIENPTSGAPNVNLDVNMDAERSDSSMESSLGVLTGSPRSTGDANEASRLSSMPSSPFLFNISTPSLSSLSSIFPSHASLLRQTFERPLAASVPGEPKDEPNTASPNGGPKDGPTMTSPDGRPKDGPTMTSPNGRANHSRRSNYTPLKSFLVAFFVALFFASAFTPIPTHFYDVIALIPTHINRGLFVDFSTMLDVQSRVASTFIGGKTAGTQLAKQITRAELATRDLIVAIRFSNELQNPDILANELSAFVKDASHTAELLLDLDAKAMGTLESLIYIDEHMLRVIKKASEYKAGPLSGLVRRTPMDIVTRNFMELMAIESNALSNLIELATTASAALRRIKERLQTIRDTTYVEGAALDENRGALSSLWERLSRDHAEPTMFRTNLDLLTALYRYTEDARNHVEQALFNLKAMQGQLKELREKTVQAPIIGDRLPIDGHVMALDHGLQRVKILVQRGENYEVGRLE